MSLSTLIERISGRRADAKRATIADYDELVSRLAKDENAVDAETVDAILEAANKSPEELQNDVANRAARRGLVEQRAAAIRARAEAANLERDAQAKGREMDEAVDRFKREIQALAERRREAELVGQQVESIDEQLRKTAPPELHRQLAEIHAKRGPICKRLESANDVLRVGGYPASPAAQLLAAEKVVARNIANGVHDGTLATHNDATVESLRQKVDAAKATIAEGKAALAALETESTLIQQRMLIAE